MVFKNDGNDLVLGRKLFLLVILEYMIYFKYKLKINWIVVSL